MTNKEIGAELGVHESTVKAHVINILGKLGVNDRTLAVTTAIQRGILRIE
jgi:DNA-binding NarL/FixJ family response regulator